MAVRSLFVASAAMNAAMALASTAANLVAADRLGVGWGGVPSTAGIIGTALGAALLGGLLRSRRRVGLTVGYATAAAGAVVTTSAAAAGGVAGLVVGLLLLGLGNAAAQLSRYVAADLAPSGRAARTLGVMVWSGTAGAVAGPLLLGPVGDIAGRHRWVPEAGPLAVTVVCCLIAVASVFVGVPPARIGTPPTLAPNGACTRLLGRSTLTPLVVMATGQVVMVLIMTAMPVQMHHDDAALAVIGGVLAAHTFGMFALSPLTARLIERLGPRWVMRMGLVVLAGSGALVATVAGETGQAVALFVLGYGWNLCFIGGSAEVVRALATADVAAVEGAVDAGVWAASAAASLGSTVLLVQVGTSGLTLVSLVLIAPAVLLLVTKPRRPHASSGDVLRSEKRARWRSAPGDQRDDSEDAGPDCGSATG